MNCIHIEARDIPDAWFLCIDSIIDNGDEYVIERGSNVGQKRLEFDYITVRIKYPGTRPLLPDIPVGLGIPNPVAEGYLEDYLPYLMTSDKHPNEDYTYGEYLELQIEEVIRMYREDGHATNQAYMTVGAPEAIYLDDPPCVLPDTLIITEGGVKEASEIVIGDRVLGHDGKFNSVKQVFKSQYQGNIWGISRTATLESFITSKHPLLGVNTKTCPYDKNNNAVCKSNCKKQKSSYEKHGTKCPKIYSNYKEEWTNVEDCKDFYVRSFKMDAISTKRLAQKEIDKYKFYGYFLGDGCLLKPDKKDEGIKFTIYRHDHALINDIERIAKNVFGKNVTKKITDNVCQIFIYSRKICRDFKKMFYDVTNHYDSGKGGGKYTCYYKIIPIDFLSINTKLQQSLIQGLVCSDGYIKSNGVNTFYVTSKKLIALLSIIMSNCYPRYGGYKRGLSKDSTIDNRIIKARKTGFEFHFNPMPIQKESFVVHNDNRYEKLNIKNKQKYSGDVYNFEVENSNSYNLSGIIPSHNCLRHIDTRIKDGKLHFIVYFRSWDLWSGMPANLGAIQLLKEYMGDEIGVDDGEIIASSKGLHIYDYAWELAKIRSGKI